MKLGIGAMLLAGALSGGSWLATGKPDAQDAGRGWILLEERTEPAEASVQPRLRTTVEAGCRSWRDCRVTQTVRVSPQP